MATNRQALPADPEQDAARKRLDSLYANIAKAEEELSTFKDLTSEIEESKKAKKALEDKIKDLEAKTLEAEKSLNGAKTKNDTFVLGAKKQEEDLLKEIKNLQENIFNLTDDLNKVKGEIDEKTRFLSDLKAEHERTKATLEGEILGLEAKKIQIRDEVNELEKQSIVARNTLAEGNQAITLAEARNKDLEQEKEDIDKYVLGLKNELVKLIKEGEKQEEANKVALEEAEARKAKVEADIAKAISESEDREKDLIVREKFVKKSIEKLHTYKTQMEDKYGERFPDLKF